MKFLISLIFIVILTGCDGGDYALECDGQDCVEPATGIMVDDPDGAK